MTIYYSSAKDEKILSDERLLRKHYGADFSAIRNRLSELRAAKCLDDIPSVPPPARHKLTGDYAGCWGIRYSRNDRIVVCPEGDFNINDLTTITSIRIITLRDYH